MIDMPFDFLRGMDVLITILTISLSLCFIRLYLGPTVPNRTVAFDSIAIHATAILALYAIRVGAPSILDVAVVVAVLGFLGTVMLARYLERSAPLYYAILRKSDLPLDEALRQAVVIEARGSYSASPEPGREANGDVLGSSTGEGQI